MWVFFLLGRMDKRVRKALRWSHDRQAQSRGEPGPPAGQAAPADRRGEMQQQAVELYRKAIAEGYDTVHSRYYLGKLLVGLRQFEAAATEFEQVLAKDLNHRDALFADAWPHGFGEVLRYPLFTGGKRVRPILTLLAYESVHGAGCDVSAALPAGLAVELIHTYSLVHDDLPCMDDDDERRGRPTVHVKYGEGPAVLVGDSLLTEAFALALRAPGLSDTQRVQVGHELAHVAGYLGMIGGQAADVGLGGSIEDVETLTRLHRGKTGALIRGSCRLGAIVADANREELLALSAHGEAIGLAFQLADDVLDAEEDAGDDGPPSYVKLMGIERCQAKADSLFHDSLQALDGLGAKADTLRDLAAYTIQREI